MSEEVKRIDVGVVTAFADAKRAATPYPYDREKFRQDLANLGTTAAEVEANRQEVADNTQAVADDKTAVAADKASAAQSAAAAAQSAENAHTDALAATAAKEAAQTAQGIAVEAKEAAAESKTAAENAQTEADQSARAAAELALAAQNAAQTATEQAQAASDSATAAAQSADAAAESARTLTIDTTLTQAGQAAEAKKVGEEITDLKSAIDTIGNVKTGIVVSANSWENFPFKFKEGIAYTFYNLSTAVVSVRSRVEADEMTGDLFGTFGPNTATVITPTMDANYIRITSTAANTRWKVSKNDTEIGIINANIALLDAATDELSNIKLDKSVWENNISATVTAAGTYVNFPYKIEKDHIYEFLVLDSGNTMSAYTRATESGANIDFIGTVAFGTKQVFTASANANYVRVNSYLPNGKFSVKDTGSASYQIKELEPKTPVLNLPKKLYAVAGKELNIYFDNICENSEAYRFDVTCSKGRQMERGFQITPIDTDAGNYTLKIDAYLDEAIIASAESSLIIKNSSAGSGSNISFILMGDSTVSGTDAQIVANFADDAMSVSSLGTRGTSPASHEGRTGWTFQYYYNSAEIGGITNPFRNPTSGVFDASYYFTNTGISAPDWFIIQLGINDVFLKTDDSAVHTQINTCVTQCDAMIASLKSAEPSIKIGIAITIPPNRSQDAFGKAYGCGQTRDRYKRNNILFVQKFINEYDDRETENIFLIPIHTNLDTIYNMGLESTPVNARNSAVTYQSPIANGGVHPVESGYQQLADVYMAFLKAQA